MKIAIASGKGGTGKTFIATNLAAVAAQTYPVKLFDLDVEEPNDHLFFKGEAAKEQVIQRMIPIVNDEICDYCGLCSEICEYNAVVTIPNKVLVFPDLCHSCYGCLELCPQKAISEGKKDIGTVSSFPHNGIDLIQGKLKLRESAVPQLIMETKKYSSSDDQAFNIYDAPPGTSCPVIEAVKDMDFIILVTEPTPFGLHDMDLVVQVLKELKKPFQVVINKSGNEDALIETYCQKNKIPVLSKIPMDKAIAMTYAGGQLTVSKFPEIQNRFSEMLERIITLQGEKLR